MVVLFCTTAAAPGLGQPAPPSDSASLRTDCDPTLAGAHLPNQLSLQWLNENPDARFDDYALHTRLIDLRTSIEYQLKEFAHDASDESLSPDSIAIRSFRHQLERFALNLDSLNTNPPRDTQELPDTVRDRFEIGPTFHLFQSNDRIDLYPLKTPVRRQICWRAMAIYRVMHAVLGRVQSERSLREREKHHRLWVNYAAYGYSRFPWEPPSIPSVAQQETTLPPAMTFVVAHLSLAAEVAPNEPRLAGPTLLGSLALEPLGLLFYPHRHKHFYGVSAVLTASSAQGLGYGGLVHLDDIAIGVAWHPRPGGERNTVAAVFAVDVWRWIDRSRSTDIPVESR